MVKKYKYKCLFVISSMWFNVQGYHSSFAPMKLLGQESCVLEVNRVFYSETRQASILYHTTLFEGNYKGTTIICLLVNYSYYFLLFHVCTENILES